MKIARLVLLASMPLLLALVKAEKRELLRSRNARAKETLNAEWGKAKAWFKKMV